MPTETLEEEKVPLTASMTSAGNIFPTEICARPRRGPTQVHQKVIGTKRSEGYLPMLYLSSIPSQTSAENLVSALESGNLSYYIFGVILQSTSPVLKPPPNQRATLYALVLPEPTLRGLFGLPLPWTLPYTVPVKFLLSPISFLPPS